MERRVLIALGVSTLAVSVLALAACGDSSPSQPTPAPTVAPTPAPVPTPTPGATPTPVPGATRAPLSVVPPCKLPASQGTIDNCSKPEPERRALLEPEMNAALDRVVAERPDLFDLADTMNGNPKVKDREAYHVAVAAALGDLEVCASIQDERIAVKKTNDFNELWNIWTSTGYLRRKYVQTCTPPLF